MVVTRSGKDTNENEEHQIPKSSPSKSTEDVHVGLSREDFQQILEDRKAESERLAEIKRFEGLRSIRERKSRTGVEPLDRFPKKVWSLVVAELTPQDKANLWQVHPWFQDLMKSYQIGDILFPLILDQVKGFTQNYLGDSRLQNATLMELRCVSKSMRNAVNKFYEDDLLTFISMKTVSRNYSSWDSYKKPIQLKMTFDDAELKKIVDIEKPFEIFKRDMIVSIANPAHGYLNMLDQDARHRYFNLFVANITKALEQVGDQIWRFKFYYQHLLRFGVSQTRICSLLKDWLRYLPNVRFIDLHIYTFSSPYVGDSSLWSEGFPTLHALKRLDMHSYRGRNTVELQIVDAIILANPQIAMVNLNEASDYRIMSRPSITALTLESCQLRIRACSMLFKKIETNVGSFNWNLKILELNFLNTTVPMDSLIRLLNKLPNLECVLLLPHSIEFSEDEIDFLHLPKLLHFGIEVIHVKEMNYDRKAHFVFSLDFLIHSPRLESIIWTNYVYKPQESLPHRIQLYEEEHREEVLLDFGGGFKNLSDSNLWDVFPYLKHIQVQCRDMYKNTSSTQMFHKPRGFLSSSAPLQSSLWTFSVY